MTPGDEGSRRSGGKHRRVLLFTWTRTGSEAVLLFYVKVTRVAHRDSKSDRAAGKIETDITTSVTINPIHASHRVGEERAVLHEIVVSRGKMATAIRCKEPALDEEIGLSEWARKKPKASQSICILSIQAGITEPIITAPAPSSAVSAATETAPGRQ